MALVLGGGGIRGIFTIGALEYFSDKLHLFSVFSGTSIGSLLCLLLVVGYTPSDIFSILGETDITSFFTPDIKGFFNNFGLVSMDKFQDFVESLLERKGFERKITFSELYTKTGKTLIVPVFNVINNCTEYISNKVTESNEGSVSEIVIASCTVPSIFAARRVKENLYIDGGVLDNLPTEYIRKTFPELKILAISVSSSLPKTIPKNIWEFIYRIMFSIHYEKENKKRDSCDLLIKIETQKPTSYDISITKQEILRAFAEGYSCAAASLVSTQFEELFGSRVESN